MMLNPEVSRHHLAYSRWANARLVEAAEALSPEELTRDFRTADKSVLGTLFHIFSAERVWLARVEESNSVPPYVKPEDQNLPQLRSDWPGVQERWSKWVESLDDAALSRPVAYRDLQGNVWNTPPWQIILHLVNHGTHHRGQVSGFLRAFGQTPPQLDLIAYYRQLAS